MKKALMVSADRCTGCRICEIVCSLKKEGVVNPSRSRIHIVHWEEKAIEIPIVCQQCETPLCLEVCPVNARSQDKKLGRIKIDYDICIGCKMCIVACPFGSTCFDPLAKKIISCDLCQGDPECVKFCETKAIEYVETTMFNMRKRREAAKKLFELIQKFAE